MDSQKSQNKECCPQFNPELWDGKIIEWNDKKFIKDHVCTFFYMPCNFGKVMKRMNEKITNAKTEIPEWLCLSDHTSKWNMDIFLAVDKVVPNADNITLSGKYLCKVYEGSFNDTGKWCKDFETFAKLKGLSVKKMYMWYTTCPKCAKKYGKNYVVIVSLVD